MPLGTNGEQVGGATRPGRAGCAPTAYGPCDEGRLTAPVGRLTPLSARPYNPPDETRQGAHRAHGAFACL